MKTLLQEILRDNYSSAMQAELDLQDEASKSAFTDRAIRIARRERDLWQNGRKKETYASMKPVLRKYWTEGLRFSRSFADKMIRDRVAWSAAFISYVIREAGAGDLFRYSSAHWKYIREAKRNAMSNSSNPFWLFRIDHEDGPFEGELICNTRSGSRMTFENAHLITSHRNTHCDIVIERRTDRLVVIGGNKGNSVKEQILWLDGQGRFDLARNNANLRKSTRGEYFGIISIW